jgi:hypothetical protein
MEARNDVHSWAAPVYSVEDSGPENLDFLQGRESLTTAHSEFPGLKAIGPNMKYCVYQSSRIGVYIWEFMSTSEIWIYIVHIAIPVNPGR